MTTRDTETFSPSPAGSFWSQHTGLAQEQARALPSLSTGILGQQALCGGCV